MPQFSSKIPIAKTPNNSEIILTGSKRSGSEIVTTKTPNKSGLTPIRPDKSPHARLRHRSGLNPLKPDYINASSKSPYIFNSSKKIDPEALNRSGITPIRPDRSPRLRHRYRSGLTPIRPDNIKGTSKSPFSNNSSIKMKSGLLPIKPEVKKQTVQSEYIGSSFAGRRKSGLKPIRPGGNFAEKNSDSSLWGQSSFYGGSSTTNSNAMRRKSGLAPLKTSLQYQRTNTGTFQSQKKNNVSLPLTKKILPEPDEGPAASLNTISEETDSRSGNCGNLSGFGPLDDSADASFLELPSKNSNSVLKKSRLSKRVLQFAEDETTVCSQSNVLKENGPTSNSAKTLKSTTKTVVMDEDILEKKKTVIEESIRNLQSELREINEQLRSLRCKKDEESKSENQQCSMLHSDSDDAECSFGNISSPCLAGPLELLTLDKSKKPENIYKVFRQSCSFLKTPKPSAFNRDSVIPNELKSETPNISRRLQQQLADLFDE